MRIYVSFLFLKEQIKDIIIMIRIECTRHNSTSTHRTFLAVSTDTIEYFPAIILTDIEYFPAIKNRTYCTSRILSRLFVYGCSWKKKKTHKLFSPRKRWPFRNGNQAVCPWAFQVRHGARRRAYVPEREQRPTQRRQRRPPLPAWPRPTPVCGKA